MQRWLLRRLMLILVTVGTMWAMWCSQRVGSLLVVAHRWWTMHRVWVRLLLHQVVLRLRLGSRLGSRHWLMVRARRMLRRRLAWLLVRQ